MKTFFKRFWWLWIILGIGSLILFGGAAYDGYKKDQLNRTRNGALMNQENEPQTTDGQRTRAFTDADLVAANQALAKGVKINDSQSDFYQYAPGATEPSDNRPDNPNPYPIGWTDFKSFSFGADQNYFYVKYEYWDKFPMKEFAYNGDSIDSSLAGVELTFTNNEGKSDTADLHDSVNYEMNSGPNGSKNKLRESVISHIAMISPISLEPDSPSRTYSDAGMIDGGPGTDYILSAFPLRLFNFKFGDTITFSVSGESGSTIYHHEAVDSILAKRNQKSGDTIQYELGSSTYQDLGDPEKIRSEGSEKVDNK